MACSLEVCVGALDVGSAAALPSPAVRPDEETDALASSVVRVPASAAVVAAAGLWDGSTGAEPALAAGAGTAGLRIGGTGIMDMGIAELGMAGVGMAGMGIAGVLAAEAGFRFSAGVALIAAGALLD